MYRSTDRNNKEIKRSVKNKGVGTQKPAPTHIEKRLYTMAYIRKTKDEYRLLCNYGYG